jgi:hypothetical protein
MLFDVFPNPSNSNVCISTNINQNSNICIYICDALGLKIWETNGEFNNLEIEICQKINNLPSGIYFLRIFEQKNNIIQKIVKY